MVLCRSSGYRRILAVRLAAQFGDGLFQIGLTALFFFSPQSAGTAAGVAAAFVVTLLPFTIVGPWAGVLLDRWYRRQILLVGNIVRVVLTALTVLVMATWGLNAVVYVLALLVLSVNRFLLAALTAALPRVVERDRLLTANAITPTLGTGAAALGAATGLAVGVLLPDATTEDSVILVLACVFFAVAAGVATLFPRAGLGPDQRVTGSVRQQLSSLTAGLVDGGRHLLAARTPAAGLGVMGASRFLYGVNFVAVILIARNVLSSPGDTAAGLAMFSVVLGASAVGYVIAAVTTPVVQGVLSPQRWVVVCVLVGVVGQAVLLVAPSRAAVLVSIAVLGLSTQGTKIAADTIVQADTADAFRGRAFALYDVLFNGSFAVGAVVAAFVLPDPGYSRPVIVALSAGYLVLAAAYGRLSSRWPHTVTTTPAPSATPRD